MLLFSPYLSCACGRLHDLGMVDGGACQGAGQQSELLVYCTSCKGIAQVTLSGTSAGMTVQIAFTQRGQGVLQVWKVEPFPPVSSLLPLPGAFAGHLKDAHFLLPLGQSVSVAVAGLVPPVVLEVSVEPQPPWLACLCWYLWSSWPLLYWWLLESMEKRDQSLLSCWLGVCVKCVNVRVS